MNKALLFICACFFGLSLSAQQQLRNFSFETWTSTENPDYWGTAATLYSMFNCSELCVKDSTKATDGNVSALLTADFITGVNGYLPGTLTLSSALSGYPLGAPLNEMPDSFAFDYQFQQGVANDTPAVSFQVNKNGVYAYGSNGYIDFAFTNVSSWQTLTFPFNNPGGGFTPDSIWVSFIATNTHASYFPNSHPKLWIDNVRLIYNHMASGVADFNNTRSLCRLYPNPNSGDFTLDLTNDLVGEVEITDALGRVTLANQKIEKQQHFNIGQIEPGVYFARVLQNGEPSVIKFNVLR